MNVIIYTTPFCQWCKATKEFLAKKKIKFTEKDVSKNKKLVQEMVKKSGQYGVPVLDIQGKIIIGYNQEEIEKTVG